MNVVTKCRMDLTRPEHTPQVFCVQGDALSRMVELELLADGGIWLVPDDASVLITYYKPDGSCGTYDRMPSGSQAWVIRENVIRLNLTPQMLTMAGLVVVQLKLMVKSEILSTFSFHVLVKPGLAPGDAPESYSNWLTAYLPQTSGAANGQYLCVSQVDDQGHVTGIVATELSVPADYEERMEQLEYKVQATEQLDSRVSALEERAASAEARIVTLEQTNGDIEQISSRVSALEADSGTVDQLQGRVSALEADSGAVDQLQGRVSALEGNSVKMDGRISTLEGSMEDIGQVNNKITQLENAVEDLDSRVADQEAGSAAYPAVWEEKVDNCIRTIEQYQQECGISSFSFAFFSDNHNRGGCAGALLDKVMDACGMPYAFFCGDMIGEGVQDPQTVQQQIQQFNTMMAPLSRDADCRALGEDDYCHMDSSGKIRPLTEMQIYELFFRKQLHGQQRFPGGNGSYYFVEDPIHKIRFIVLNSVWMEQELDEDGALVIRDGYGFGQEQVDWLINTALNFPEFGWSVVFISHCPLSTQEGNLLRDAHVVKGIIGAFMENGSYSGYYDGPHSVSVEVDFLDANTADVIGWFCGHSHLDGIVNENIALDTNILSELYLNTVTIADDGTFTGDQGHTIDFVTVDKDARTVYLTRLGYGQDRSFSY